MTPLEKLTAALSECGIPHKVESGGLTHKGQPRIPKYFLTINGTERKVWFQFDDKGNYEETVYL